MNAVAPTPYEAPECRIGEHGYCPGPGTTVVGGAVIMRRRCACTCHAAAKRDATEAR